MKSYFQFILFACCAISLTSAFGSSIQTNQMVWADFEPLSSSESNLVANVKDSIAQHLADSFKVMQYKCASLVLDNQSWVQSQENGILRFSGRLDFNAGVSSEQQHETTSPSPRFQGGQVVLSFPTPRGGISTGELCGMLFVEDLHGLKRKLSIGVDKDMRIRFGPKPDKQ